MAIAVAALTLDAASAQDLSAPKWTPWLELGGSYGSNDTSRGEAVLWVPLAQSHNSVLFGEARGKLFEDDMREGNFALGYREMQANGWNIGVWGGYDIRESQFGNTFHQLAGGIEALSDRWDIRANAYLPLNDSETLFTFSSLTAHSFAEINGPNIGMITRTIATRTTMEELALWGFDAEIGAKIFSTPLDLSGPSHELRLYAGAFHFDHSDLPNSVTGPRVRAEWRMDDVIDQWAGSRLTFEAEYSHDQLRDDRVEVGARLRLPFGDSSTRVASRSLTSQERRMSEGLERDTDIVSSTATTTESKVWTATEAVEDAKTGVRFDRVATADGTSGITGASVAAGANSLIIATGDIDGPQTLGANQTLQGGGATIQVRGVTSGIVVDFTAPGTRPTLTTTVTDPLLSIAGSNTHVAGVNLSGDGSQSFDYRPGIFGENVTNVHIADVTASGLANAAIYFDRSSLSVSNIDIRNSAGHGMYFIEDNIVEISHATISNVSGSGILADLNNRLTISDTSVRNVATNGLAIVYNNSASVSRMTVENAGGNVFVLTNDNNHLALNDSYVSGINGGPLNAGILVFGFNNSLSGGGNVVAPGTVFGGAGFCAINGGAVGSIGFNIGTCP